ncbi:MAG: hypothetical protein Q8Q49_05640 [bacterium]|nr:hypothetical protein [bacterium]
MLKFLGMRGRGVERGGVPIDPSLSNGHLPDALNGKKEITDLGSAFIYEPQVLTRLQTQFSTNQVILVDSVALLEAPSGEEEEQKINPDAEAHLGMLKNLGYSLIFWTGSERDKLQPILRESGLAEHLDLAIYRENYVRTEETFPKYVAAIESTSSIDKKSKRQLIGKADDKPAGWDTRRTAEVLFQDAFFLFGEDVPGMSEERFPTRFKGIRVYNQDTKIDRIKLPFGRGVVEELVRRYPPRGKSATQLASVFNGKTTYTETSEAVEEETDLPTETIIIPAERERFTVVDPRDIWREAMPYWRADAEEVVRQIKRGNGVVVSSPHGSGKSAYLIPNVLSLCEEEGIASDSFLINPRIENLGIPESRFHDAKAKAIDDPSVPVVFVLDHGELIHRVGSNYFVEFMRKLRASQITPVVMVSGLSQDERENAVGLFRYVANEIGASAFVHHEMQQRHIPSDVVGKFLGKCGVDEELVMFFSDNNNRALLHPQLFDGLSADLLPNKYNPESQITKLDQLRSNTRFSSISHLMSFASGGSSVDLLTMLTNLGVLSGDQAVTFSQVSKYN